MRFTDLRDNIRADLLWVNGKPIRTFIQRYIYDPGFKYMVWLRITRFFYKKNPLLYILSGMIYKHYGYKFGFDVSFRAELGKGLQIAHRGYIIIPSNTKIGEYCTLRPGVVVGKKLSEKMEGAVIGDNVNFGVGCKIIGGVHIGNNVIIGANAVVTKDVPENAIVAGVPARIISYRTND